MGDWIVGLSPKARGNRVVYAMQVDEILPFKDYYRDQRFAAKIPDMDNKEVKCKCGDNIYKPLPEGGFEQVCPSLHSNGLEENPKTKKTDLSGRNVLISRNFHYFGRNGPELPNHLTHLRVGIGHKCNFPPEVIKSFKEFIIEFPKGVNGPPTKWPDGDSSWRPGQKCG